MSFDVNTLGADLPFNPPFAFDQTLIEGKAKLMQRAILLLLRDNNGDNEQLGTSLAARLPGQTTSSPDVLANSASFIQDDLRRSLQTVQDQETDLTPAERMQEIEVKVDASAADSAIFSILITTEAGDTVGVQVPIKYGSM